ncbi:TetR/AcrR family transcriptional regulator [Nocardia sp. NPDC049707]|uniref:TetR/AcrR family transcriptional regulator n=1 Tax=Nocardia sp. NPDC049707 TaxID=3154735 RepID=UPI003416E210
MPRSSAPNGRTGRPPLTSRAQIVDAARQLIDRDGWETLTIRRLAAEIGVGATTLYHHIRDKEDLLILLVNHHVEQVERPRLPADPPNRIVVAATVMHDVLADWPWAAEVLTADGFVARLDASALWMVEAIVAAAIDHGCTPEQAVDIFRNIWYYTVGEILVRAHSADRPTGTELRALPEAFFSGHDASLVPQLVAIGDRWPALASRDIYPTGLRVFVHGLLEQATSATPNRAG